jgi:hypothetical protein
MPSCGIENWARDFAPHFGTVAEFVRRHSKVLSLNEHTFQVTLSAAAASVASASLEASASETAAPLAHNDDHNRKSAAAPAPAPTPAPVPAASASVFTSGPMRARPYVAAGAAADEKYSSKPKVRYGAQWGYEEPMATIIDILMMVWNSS